MRAGVLVLAAGVSACVATGGELPEPIEPESAAAGVSVIPDAAPFDDDTEPSVPRPDEPVQPEPAWALTPGDVLLQLEYEPTFAAARTVDPFATHGRIPEVTLYEDGTVIYERLVDGTKGVYLRRVGEPRASQHHAHALELGIEQVGSYEEDCRPSARGRLCVSDASIVILRVRRADGTRHEIRSYAGWAGSHEAILHAIYDRLEILQKAPAWDEELFRPERATLFLEVERGSDDADAVAALPGWPLASELFERVHAEKKLVLAIDAATIGTLVRVLGTNAVRSEAFRRGDRVVRLGLVPWLPGVDHPALERWPAEDRVPAADVGPHGHAAAG